MHVKAIVADFFEARGALSQLLAQPDPVVLVPPRFEPMVDDLVPPLMAPGTIGFFSSGSTAAPRLHVLNRAGLQVNAAMSVPAFGLEAGQRVLILASPWHIAGFTWYAAAEAAGADVCLEVPWSARLPDLAGVVSDFRPDVLFTVPSVLNRLLDSGLGQVEHLITGGAPVLENDLDRLARHCARFTQAYGQTEAGGLLTSKTIPAESLDRRWFRNCGVPPEGIALRVEGSAGHGGPVLVRTPSGIAEGWYDTGDLGRKTPEGDLIVTGRKENAGNCNSLTGITTVLHK